MNDTRRSARRPKVPHRSGSDGQPGFERRPQLPVLGVAGSLLAGLVAAILSGSTARAQTPTATPPTLTVNDVSVTEGNSRTKTAVFTIRRSGAVTGTSAVNWATANGRNSGG